MAGDGHVLLSGGTDSIRTAHQAGLNITGDFEAIMCVAANGWSPAGIMSLFAKWQGSTDAASIAYAFRIHSANNGIVNPVIYDTVAGAMREFFGSTLSGWQADGAHTWIRVLVDVNNGAGGISIRVYRNPSAEVGADPASITWVLLGSTITEAGAAVIGTNSQPLWLGLNRTTNDPFIGKYYYFELRTGTTSGDNLNSPVTIAKMDARDASPVGSDGFGNSWSLASGATWVAPSFSFPANLTAVKQGSDSILVDWDAVPDADAYDVERDGVVIASHITPTQYLDEGLNPSTEYDYRVRAARQV